MGIRAAMIAAECEPWAKVGGLADVVDALARALGRLPEAAAGELHAPLDVFLPRYRGTQVPADAVTEPPLRIADPATGEELVVSIVDVAGAGYRVRLVDHPPAFDRAAVYGHRDDAWRFAVLCRATLAALRRDPSPPDLVHVHDWHAGPVLLERLRADRAGDRSLAGTAVLLTIHNPAYHGWTPLEGVAQLGLHQGDGILPADADGLDPLRTAIELADLVNTVSPGYAREILTPEHGMGLDAVLRGLGDRFSGILNGIDPDVWNPATDAVPAARYARGRLAGKAACRRDLLERLGFDPGDEGAVVGAIGRLDPQKGIDLVAGGAAAMLAAGVRLVVHVDGRGPMTEPLRALATARPDRVALLEGFDRDMARRIYAGADLFVMPSRFEPCGQGQMIALRYGTPPVVRRTGGLADSVIDVDERPDEGTGFLFDAPTSEAVVAAVTRAADRRRDDPTGWAALVDRGMAVDFRWDDGPARAYLEAYRRAVALRRG